MTLVPSSSHGGTGSGTVTSVAATDGSIVVAGTATDPTIATGVLNAIATAHPPTGAVALNAQKITGLANGAAATDALALGQVLAAGVIPVADLVAGTAGQVLGGTGPGYSLPPGYEINYTQITSPINVVSTTEASGTSIFAPGAIVFDGTAVLVQVFFPYCNMPTGAAGNIMTVNLFEGATQIGRFLQADTVTTATNGEMSLLGFYRFTPSAASHTYTVTAYVNSTTGTPNLGAGSGGTNGFVPAFVRFTKV